MIEVRGLAKRYGDRAALDGVSFRVDRGEVVGFLGPNGAGKTTLFRILSTYLASDGGSASIAGFDVQDQSMDVRRRLGYLPEHPPLDLDHTVDEYLRFCAALRGVARARRRGAIETVVERCTLGAVLYRRIGNLSKGYRQRVGLAQALVHDPEVLILDEPTVGLDPHQIREIRELIRTLSLERTILLSTHLLSEVSVTCARAIVIHEGRVVAQGSLDSLRGSSDLEETFLRLTTGAGAERTVKEAPP